MSGPYPRVIRHCVFSMTSNAVMVFLAFFSRALRRPCEAIKAQGSVFVSSPAIVHSSCGKSLCNWSFCSWTSASTSARWPAFLRAPQYSSLSVRSDLALCAAWARTLRNISSVEKGILCGTTKPHEGFCAG